MSYLVKFSGAQGETWEETFETEQQVLECKNKDSIVSIQKIEEELTLEQLQEQVDNKTPQKLQEADFKGKHIKVGDMVFFEREFYHSRDDEHYYRDFYGIIKSIISHNEEITVTITTIAFDNGELLEPYNKQKKETKQWCMVIQPETQNIRTIHAVCDENYFEDCFKNWENRKEKNKIEMQRKHDVFCKDVDEQIERLNVLKGMLC